MEKPHRFMELEGLRGIAAIVVVLYHCLQAFYPYVIYGTGNQHMRFEDNLYGTPLGAFFNGTFAVAIFFVLSGFVLSIGFFQSKRQSIIKSMAARRYLRLALPAVASVLLCLLVIKLGFARNIDAGNINGSTWLFARWEGIDPNFFNAIKEGLFDIFVNFSNSDKFYNVVLWTMTTEFVGSFIVFGFLLLFAASKYRWVVYGLLFVALFNSWMMGFVLGTILADLYGSGIIRQQKRTRWALLLLPFGLFLGGYPHGSVEGTIYQLITIPGTSWNYQLVFTLFGATVLIFAAVYVRQIAAVLAKKKISMLGKYTFSLYLVHIPIVLSLTAGMFVWLSSIMGYNRAMALSIGVTFPVLLLAVKLFEKYIDAPAIRFAKYVAEIYEGKRTVDLRTKLQLLRYQLTMMWVERRDVSRREDTETS